MKCPVNRKGQLNNICRMPLAAFRGVVSVVCCLLFGLCCLADSPSRVYADTLRAQLLQEDIIDLDADCSISVTMQTVTGETVSGGTLALYRVAGITYTLAAEHHYRFTYTTDFAGCDEGILEKLTDSTLASEMSDYVDENGIQPVATKDIGSDGTVGFTNLKVGVYLVVQTQVAEGYSSAGAFIVTIPLSDSDSVLYDVDATPKVRALYADRTTEADTESESESESGSESESESNSESESESESGSSSESESESEGESNSESESESESEKDSESESESESESGSERESESESESSSESESESESERAFVSESESGGRASTLPQTGLLLWPIQLIAGSGLLLMVLGWLLLRDSKKSR